MTAEGREPSRAPVEMCDSCEEVKVVTIYDKGPGQAYRQVLCRDCTTGREATCPHEAWEETGGWNRCTDCGYGWSSGQVPASEFTLRERIEALPESAATKSRDYGRGYAQAVRDVVRLLGYHDPSHLTEECACGEVPS